MATKQRREQRSKGRDFNRAMNALDLRQGSRTDRHRDRSKYSRSEVRRAMQRGSWE